MPLHAPTRRALLKGLAALPLVGVAARTVAAPRAPRPRVHLFSKHLQFLNYDDMAAAAAEMGFAGLDLTVRPGGHVEPERVADDLPRAVEAMRKRGLTPTMITTEVEDPTDPTDRKVLATAARLGFQVYRTNWARYSDNEPMLDTLSRHRERFAALARLNEELGIRGGYQNHAGHYVGAALWDLHLMLGDVAPAWMGVQYDVRHATVEGGASWRQDLRLIRPLINSLVAKDFTWEGGSHRPQNVPLGEGRVDFPAYFTLLKRYGIDAPLSLHFEYDLGGANSGKRQIDIPRVEVFRAMRRDLQKLYDLWDAAPE